MGCLTAARRAWYGLGREDVKAPGMPTTAWATAEAGKKGGSLTGNFEGCDYQNLLRNKRSLTLDLTTAEGRVEHLTRRPDSFLSSCR